MSEHRQNSLPQHEHHEGTIHPIHGPIHGHLHGSHQGHAQPSLLSSIKTILLVSLLTSLIWFWAEGESLTATTITLRIALPAGPAGDLLFRPAGAEWPTTVSVRLQGSTLATSAASTLANDTLILSPQLRAMPSAAGANQVIALREVIAELPELANRGLSVVEVEPRSLSVDAIRMVTRELPVRVQLGRDTLTDGEPQVRPMVVEVRVPESSQAALNELAAVPVTFPPEELSSLRADTAQTRMVTIRSPPGLEGVEPVLFTPETVQVTLRIRRRVLEHRLASVPVFVALPPTEGSQWNIEMLDKFLSDVAVTGSPDVINKVRSGELPIKAVVELSSDDLFRLANAPDGVGTRQAAFLGLPPDVSANSTSMGVRIKVGKRTAHETGGGPR